ncbi:GNAT family N-acetyltransferase [Reyranella sp.]|jgi:GNAT superfamily N-acetyltransferase|uniref:GNAT family N-acetyltransferase n=1 Tax=Reyranella sp. TaxID=1929291 RepID=UPI000BDB537D|nr:GNAT family N-acetyltransferase [Reyranella sp.]OYY46069.1 MAG: hypothetical protein B7Y57_04235 [Rhodospirillales bacterium 35-66-84]OYZ96449.1 MAG: hypothetical protein B7Y08_04595 [Rhodospirillales bacterium 24-66-33]OZB28388.1 MAG: hypothetical protein B7X63_00550 [Rhodospirillales bacterium 39-66-50]HQS14403.1 GNAT family N-acetyltransferase [Reyranella sp.]HQT11400.1 GNAT family N-acetyltransferase [Reyranella sp.]
MAAIVHSTTVAALEASSGFSELLQEYEAESLIPGVPSPAVNLESLRQLEEADAIHVLAATSEGRVIGYLAILAPFLAHYGRAVAVCDSFIMSKAHRDTGDGLKLIRAAEDKAREIGAPGLLMTVDLASEWPELLWRIGYEERSRVFTKNLSRPDNRGALIADNTTTRLQ